MLTPQKTQSEVVELSVSSWFYRNRTIAGFDNPARSLYVSVRELVENSLDACEDASVLPDIKISLQIQNEGEEKQDRIGYVPSLFSLCIKDNGCGIPREDIPRLIGRMLTGTKFTHRQSRGTFGLGGSLALLYGQITTQQPIEIMTGVKDVTTGHRVILRLDIENNLPIILEEEEYSKNRTDHGTTIRYSIQGDWIRSKRKITDYFAQTSIIVPYASIQFHSPDDERFDYPRVVEVVPSPTREMQPHPRGIDVEMLKTMIGSTEARTLKTFFSRSFHRVGEKTALDFLHYAGFDGETSPEELTSQQLVEVMNALSKYPKFMAPSADALSPAGEDVLIAGIGRLNPEIIKARTRNPSVYEGCPFVVEVGIAYGGNLLAGTQLFRFANRIPLLYDEGSDVSTKVVRGLNFKNYGFRAEDPLAFFVHICSTKIPYKTVGKEYIGNVDSVRREIDLGFKECLRELGKAVRRKQSISRRMKRESRLLDYYSFIADTLSDALNREVGISRLLKEE